VHINLHCEFKKQASLLCQMLADFHNTFASRLAGKFAIKLSLNIPLCLKCVATLPCEICMFKNCHGQGLSEANCHKRLSHSNSHGKKYLHSHVSIT